MEKTEESRNKWLHIRLTAKESEIIRRKVQRTTCRKISDYARKIILSEPITINYRNESLDSLMNTLIELRRELSAIGNNFNQVVKRLQTLSQISEYRSWLDEYEQDKNTVLKMIETIQSEISKAAKTWLQ
ncbi:plasmid mobilization protein [Dyadobacter sp.]|uniref:plasmid mobilization protein n=1 Tax=Dyadobacter sp. TaxID=1914288 RepID=UPI003F6F73E8